MKEYMLRIQKELIKGNHCQFQPLKEINNNYDGGLKYIKTITDGVCSIIKLNDNTLACSSIMKMEIINPYNDYHSEQVIINNIMEPIPLFCQLKNGSLVSCTEDFDIIIGNQLIERAHDMNIQKIIELSNNRIAFSLIR